MTTRFEVEVIVFGGDIDTILLGSFEAVKQVVQDNDGVALVTAIDSDEAASFIPSSNLVGGTP